MDFSDLIAVANAKEQALKDARKEFMDLVKMLSIVDKKQEDILHCLEFNKYNAVDMMRLVKSLIACRKVRREIKAKRAFAQRIFDVTANKLEKFGAIISDMKDFQLTSPYKCKVMKDIFDTNEFNLETLRNEVK